MKQKGYLLATASGFAVAAAGGAQAADMAIKSAPVLAPAASWAGWYVGLNAGANWQQAQTVTAYDGPNGSATSATTSFIGGGQIGYNWQDGNFVYGLEGDISGLTGKANSALDGKQVSNQITWLSTVRGRTGLAVGNTMAYLTGGVAFGGVKNSAGYIGDPYSKSESKTRVGWTVGGGVEHMITNTHWTVAMEAMFVDLGQSTGPSTGTDHNKSGTFSNQAVIGRFKLNYKF
jgi:outer membrane immunogenic protein